MTDISSQLCEQIQQANADGVTLRIKGGGSHADFGRDTHQDDAAKNSRLIDVTAHKGVISYYPEELTITVRAGTTLNALSQVLAEQGQMLAFEPPLLEHASIGASLAMNLNGPRRAYTGSVRDYVLGIKLINDKAQELQFGGQVIKNVAGYDVTRLQAGAGGTLGLISELSFKVLPLPQAETTLFFAQSLEQSRQQMLALNTSAWPLSGLCADAQGLWLRLSGNEKLIQKASANLGGEAVTNTDIWQQESQRKKGFFKAIPAQSVCYRFSCPTNAVLPPVDGTWLLGWGGQLRYLRCEKPLPWTQLEALAQSMSATLSVFSGGDRTGQVFQNISPALLQLHKKIKNALDPSGLFNPGRLYEGL